eukprot:1088449-Pelagomonas_calceolata.AAC.4
MPHWMKLVVAVCLHRQTAYDWDKRPPCQTRRSVQQQQQQQQQPDRDTPAAAGNAPASAPPLTASASAPASASASASAATPCTTTAAPTSSAGGAATEGGCQQTSTLPNSGVAVSVAGQHEGPQGGSISAVPSSLSLRAFALRKLRMCICCQFLSKLGEYVEALAPILQEGGVDTLIKLLEQHANDPRILYDTLDALCALLAHKRVKASVGAIPFPRDFNLVCVQTTRCLSAADCACTLYFRFAELFVAAGGVQLMLGIPRGPAVLAYPLSFPLSGGVRQLLVSLRAGMVLLSSSDTTLDLRIERQVGRGRAVCQKRASVRHAEEQAPDQIRTLEAGVVCCVQWVDL